ncbi:uric acid degradation bifunctional protein TTL-like isoform X5 [Glycine soja]|uniref:uric acid degradation bifunctional protein TTL-like isoform X5 n=1 Tax=Glycine soja TaxID=3848 RepID=UPI00103E10D4|nr:uric acid degradation bifunctional protein TTL-like isoform X5 [Glycine soja]
MSTVGFRPSPRTLRSVKPTLPLSPLKPVLSSVLQIQIHLFSSSGSLSFSCDELSFECKGGIRKWILCNKMWSKGEQSTALATATGSSLQELSEWNARYREKFGFVFLICAAGRSTDEILAELKRRYTNRPIVEFEIAAQEQMKITELRLAKLFSSRENISSSVDKYSAAKKAEEDRISIIGGHVTAASEISTAKLIHHPARTRPPITTHVLDVSQGSPAAGIEVLLEVWRGTQSRPTFGASGGGSWVFQGSSTTDLDGRSGQLLSIVDDVNPGIYRISFNTGKYIPNGFFPYVSLVFEIKESQKREHFHVPLLLSPFSFSTYRGS